MKREASSDAEGPPVARKARYSSKIPTRDHPYGLTIKRPMKAHFSRFCKDFGWCPTELICAKISKFLKIDISRPGQIEPALFAFVQYLPFIWDSGALFIGSKRLNGVVRSVWYKPTKLGDNVRDSLHLNHLSQKDNFSGKGSHKVVFQPEHPLVDRFWPSFITAFDFYMLRGDERYIKGVYAILLEFSKLRKSCSDDNLRAWAEGRSTTATEHVPARKYELPFFPESVWMHKPLRSERPEPIAPYTGPSSLPDTQASSMPLRHSSIREIERVQSLIQNQRARLAAEEKRKERRGSRSRGHGIFEFNQRFSNSTKATDDASEMAMEAFLNASLEADREPAPMRLRNLNAVDHGNQIFQNDNFDVSFGRPERAPETQAQLPVTFPARVPQQQLPLQFTHITSVDLPPIVPRRHLILDAICALVMSTNDDDLP